MTGNFRASTHAAIFVATAMTALPPAAHAQQDSVATASGTLQPRTENGRQTYAVEQFARFNPRTALDIVRQVPGFIIDTGDGAERGLGQADENVLINGARIPGKNNDAFTVLARIPASNVVRVEIVDGATLSISGLSGQVLNLVTNTDAASGLSGNFKWEPRWRRAGNNWFEGEASISGKLGKADFTLAIDNGSFKVGGQGLELVTSQIGNPSFTRDEIARARAERPAVTATIARTAANGSIFNASVTGGINHFRERVRSVRRQAGVADIFELFEGRENEWNAELSADYEFDFGGGRLKLIGLQRLEHSPFENFFGQTFTDGITPANGSQFDRTIDEGESVLRAEYNWRTASGSDWGLNLEGAYNFLDSEGALSQLDPQGVFQPVMLTNATSKVTEYRGEIVGSYGRPLSDKLTLQATLGGEYSQISQSGALGETRSFVRPKGSVSLAWRPENDLDVSLQVERTVGQLNFSDFVESVDVSNNANNAGNPELVPPQTWRAELETTKNLGPWGSLTVNIYGEKISDIVDSIPITATTEARGNLPSATRYGVELTSSILFDPIGWNGAKLDIEAEVRDSSLRDPLTNVFRRVNDDKIYSYEVNFRHDIPNSDWAWGAGAEQSNFSDVLRLDQINSFQQQDPFTWVFVEHKDVYGFTVNARLNNILNQGERFKRTAFVDRRNGGIDFIEDRVRKFGLVYRLTVSGSF